ncbi:MAG: hypothetical protein U0L57_05795 [Bacteroidales bacterium]|nr:hypothetical protein [Bacteroidales bacterium]
MRKLKILLLLQLFIFGANNVFAQGQAQKVSVNGQVIDANSEEALPFVNVTLLSVKDSTLIDGTVTDEKVILQ